MIPPALLLSSACRPPPEVAAPPVEEIVPDTESPSEPTGDTGSTTTPPTGDTGEPVHGLVEASVGCLDVDNIRAEGRAGEAGPVAVLDLWETGAPVGLGWNEEHDLVPSPDGELVLLLRGLVDVSVGGWYERNVVSLFECEYQFVDFAGSLTAALRVADPETGEISCLIWGHDPEMVLAGEFEEYTPVTDPASLAGCGTMTGTVTASTGWAQELSLERLRERQLAGWLGQLRYEMARAGSSCSGSGLAEVARALAEGEGEGRLQREVEAVRGCAGVDPELVERLVAGKSTATGTDR
jgi:hypothetical protein